MSSSPDSAADNPPADPDNLNDLLTQATRSWRAAIPAHKALREKLQYVSTLLAALGRPIKAPSLLMRRNAEQPVMIKEIEGSLTVGRNPAAGWPITDAIKISRIQFRVFSRNGSWWIEDTGSKNGTFVEGIDERVTLRPLANGDVITTGGLAFAFVLPE